MKKLFAQVKIAVGKIQCSSAFVRPADMMTGVEMVAAAPTMSQEDLNSPRAKAAMTIVEAMNSCVHKEQLDAVARMIDLFERKYDDTLPLRAWWRNAMFTLTYYPKNA